jgi:hypothetical protein
MMFKARVSFDVAELLSDITFIGSILRDYYCYCVHFICPTSIFRPMQLIRIHTSTFSVALLSFTIRMSYMSLMNHFKIKIFCYRKNRRKETNLKTWA